MSHVKVKGGGDIKPSYQITLGTGPYYYFRVHKFALIRALKYTKNIRILCNDYSKWNFLLVPLNLKNVFFFIFASTIYFLQYKHFSECLYELICTYFFIAWLKLCTLCSQPQTVQVMIYALQKEALPRNQKIISFHKEFGD